MNQQQKKHWYYAHNAKVDPHKKMFKKKRGFMQAVYLLSTGLHTLFASPAQKKMKGGDVEHHVTPG